MPPPSFQALFKRMKQERQNNSAPSEGQSVSIIQDSASPSTAVSSDAGCTTPGTSKPLPTGSHHGADDVPPNSSLHSADNQLSATQTSPSSSKFPLSQSALQFPSKLSFPLLEPGLSLPILPVSVISRLSTISLIEMQEILCQHLDPLILDQLAATYTGASITDHPSDTLLVSQTPEEVDSLHKNVDSQSVTTPTTIPTRWALMRPTIVCNDSNYIYIQDFLTPLEEYAMLAIISHLDNQTWVKLSYRSLQMFGGKVSSSGLEDGEPLPQWLQDITTKLELLHLIEPSSSSSSSAAAATTTDQNCDQKCQQLNTIDSTSTNNQHVPCPNHVLLNYYEPNGFIFPHLDGPNYFPCAFIVSLLSSLSLSFWKDHTDAAQGITKAQTSLYLERRSLFIMKKQFYFQLLHGIQEPKEHIGQDIITSTHVNHHVIRQKQQFELPIDAAATNVGAADNITGPTCSELQQGVPIGSISRRCTRLSLTLRYAWGLQDQDQQGGAK